MLIRPSSFMLDVSTSLRPRGFFYVAGDRVACEGL